MATESPNGTVVLAGSTAAIVDSSGNSYTILNHVVQMNGKPLGLSSNVSETAYVDYVVWQKNSANLWWVWANGTWTPNAGTSKSPLVAATMRADDL